jgi:predicted dehydrogenase
MKAVVVGTGSIGQRHIGNLLHLGAEVSAFSYRGKSPGDLGLDSRVSLVERWFEGISSDCDVVVIANSTEQHMEVALQAARLGRAIYIEKPLAGSLDGTAALSHLIASNRLVVETGFMLRAHPNLVWMKNAIDGGMLGELMHFRASVGQWLPDWRPGTDHRLAYSAVRDKGGGVIFDLIHELDLLHWLGGRVSDISAMTRHIPMLGIETEAIAQIGLRLDSGVLAQVHLDYVRPGYERTMQVVGHKGVLFWNYSEGTVTFGSPDGTAKVVHRLSPEFERNTIFLASMEHFLRRLETPGLRALSSFEDGMEALRIALACHRSASERRNVRPDELK